MNDKCSHSTQKIRDQIILRIKVNHTYIFKEMLIKINILVPNI
jgi:hypothetical protein